MVTLPNASELLIRFFTTHPVLSDCLIEPFGGMPNSDVTSGFFELGRPLRRPQASGLRFGHPARADHLVELLKDSVLPHGDALL